MLKFLFEVAFLNVIVAASGVRKYNGIHSVSVYIISSVYKPESQFETMQLAQCKSSNVCYEEYPIRVDPEVSGHFLLLWAHF